MGEERSERPGTAKAERPRRTAIAQAAMLNTMCSSLPLPSAHEGIRVAYLRAYGSPSGFAAATKDDCILRNSRGVHPHRRDTKPRGASTEIGPQLGKGRWTAPTI